MEKIGIFGGSFNPTHIGHLIMAEQFSEQCDLESCHFVPASISPFKSNKDDYEFISHTQRLDILDLSVKDNPKFKVNTFEIEKGGISYSIDTVRYFAHSYADKEIYLLMGYDQARSFHKWKNWEEILAVAHIAIAGRPCNSINEDEAAINERFTRLGKSPVWLTNPMIEISSSDIRRRIKNGLSVKYLVNQKAEEYINAYKIYQ